MRRSAHSVHVLTRRPAVAAHARFTVPRVVSVLRRTRHAIEQIEVQLDDVLDHLRGKKVLERGAPDRLRASANEARAAMASLSDFSDLYG